MATVWASLLALVLCLAPATAQTFPDLTGRVVDTADLIDPATEASITEKLAAFEQRSSDQIAVATVPDLQGTEIEDYANRLARQWALGREGEDNGVLLLVARDERKVRIEVGYGLEGTLTDALSRVIIENDILPAFRKGDYSAGVAAGVDGILTVLSGDAAELEARAKRNEGWQRSSGEDISNLVFFGFVFLFMAGPVIFASLARLFGRRVGPGRYRWLGMTTGSNRRRRGRGVPVIFPGGFGGGRGGGGFGGGFSGGGGSFGGGGASGGW
ncbi:TPM domain-containing protein [Consotaella aegiceratis]|uniref:TPM domain-containing protein n=1 Tax=Consotaella aegiceratis TaxID=3097961 RepID=UPI002F409EB4